MTLAEIADILQVPLPFLTGAKGKPTLKIVKPPKPPAPKPKKTKKR